MGQVVSIPADFLVVGVKDEAQAPTHQTHLSLPSIVGHLAPSANAFSAINFGNSE